MFNAAMKYKSLGRCGTKVSHFSLGGWTTFGGSLKDTRLIENILTTAFRAGINYFDSADVYAKGENETVMGSVLKQFPRNELVLASKVFWPMSDDVNDRGLGRKHIIESVNRTLQRMQTDYLDIYFCHRYDTETPLEETIRVMDDLVRQGKIIYWGTSEWAAEQLQEAHKICRQHGYYPPQVEQPQYNLFFRKSVEKSVAPMAQELGMGIVTWSPLASGMLTGKYDNGVNSGRLSQMEFLKDRLYNSENVKRVVAMKALADQVGVSRTQLALAWTARHPAVSSVILGATSVEQLTENLKAIDLNLSSDVVRELDRIFPAVN